MADGQDSDFVSYMRGQAGDALRLVGVYDHRQFKVRYLREDLDRKFTERDLQAIATAFRKESLDRDHEEDVFTLGSLDATVRLFENAVVIHYPRDRLSGTVVSLEREAGMSLSSFVAECRRNLYRQER